MIVRNCLGQTGVKSCKQATKNLSDMSKELEMLNQTTTVGDLPDKMEEAETAKTEVEAMLLERVSVAARALYN